MITGQTLLTRVRLELNDPLVEGEEPKWATAELLTYANDGVRDYSKHFQRQARFTISTATAVQGADGTTEVPLPGAAARLLRVGYRVGAQVYYLRDHAAQSGDAVGAFGGLRARAQLGGRYGPSYELTAAADATDDAVALRMNFFPQAGATLLVDYLAAHALFDPDDLSVATTVPDEDEELLSLYTTAKAWNRVGGQDAALSRWDETGRRNDSPIIPREWRLFAAYRLKLNQKLAMPRALRLRRV